MLEMSIIDTAFESLFFGSGSWLGILLFLILCFAFVYAWRYSGVLLVPVTVFFALEYVGQNLGYHALIMFSSTILISYITVEGIRSKKP